MTFGAEIRRQVINGAGEEPYHGWLSPWCGGERCALLTLRCPENFCSDETVRVEPGSVWGAGDNFACLYSSDSQQSSLATDFRKACWMLWHFAEAFETLADGRKFSDRHLRVKFFTPVICAEGTEGQFFLDIQDHEILLTASMFMQLRQKGGAQELHRLLESDVQPMDFYGRYDALQKSLSGGQIGRGHLRLMPSPQPAPG